jgi:uncharacterized NAD-dependent epimerase/dehydratase family protein
MYEFMSSVIRPAKVIGICVNTFGLPEEEARKLVDEAARHTGLPATDPVRYGCENLVDALEALHKTRKANRAQTASKT